MSVNDKKIWLIGDTHFDHMNMCKHCGRPENFNQLIVHHWRKMIAPDDLVYHLGDVYFGKRSRFFDCVKELPGQKILIKGNHDKEKTEWYLTHGFVVVFEFASIIAKMKVGKNHIIGMRVLLSHVPTNIPKFDTYSNTTINIHGHFHNNDITKCEKEMVSKLTKNHYLFSLEETKYKPVLLQNALYESWLFRGK